MDSGYFNSVSEIVLAFRLGLSHFLFISVKPVGCLSGPFGIVLSNHHFFAGPGGFTKFFKIGRGNDLMIDHNTFHPFLYIFVCDKLKTFTANRSHGFQALVLIHDVS